MRCSLIWSRTGTDAPVSAICIMIRIPTVSSAVRSNGRFIRKSSASAATVGSGPDGIVFAELKKKYKHTVYKRRLPLREQEAADWLAGRRDCPVQCQIAAEIDYFLHYYETLRPAVFLSYEREAFAALDGSAFRVTFDENILCRQGELTLDSEAYGTPVLEPGRILMETEMRRRHSAVDDTCALCRADLQDFVLQIRHGVSKHSAPRAEGGRRLCLTICLRACSTRR